MRRSSHHLKYRGCLPAPSTKQPEDRKFVVEGVAELGTVRTSRNPHNCFTACGEVLTHEEATVYVKDLGFFVTVQLLENTPPVLFLVQRCEEHVYSREWTGGRKPHLFINGRKFLCNTENYVPLVVPVLLGESSSSSAASRPTSASSSQDSQREESTQRLVSR